MPDWAEKDGRGSASRLPGCRRDDEPADAVESCDGRRSGRTMGGTGRDVWPEAGDEEGGPPSARGAKGQGAVSESVLQERRARAESSADGRTPREQAVLPRLKPDELRQLALHVALEDLDDGLEEDGLLVRPVRRVLVRAREREAEVARLREGGTREATTPGQPPSRRRPSSRPKNEGETHVLDLERA